MRHVMVDDRVSEVDYLIGDDPYKQSWMGQRRERCGIVAYNPISLIGNTKLIYEAAGRLLRDISMRLFRAKRTQ
jgi:CelD/BcsL family acetyltransferase involved in cellulose biosynthesis